MPHARLAPSDAGHWGNCPGSVTMQEAFPKSEDSEDSKDGTACHWVAAEILQGKGGEPFEGKQAPNGVLINDDIIRAAKIYVEYIASVVPNLGTRGVVVEQPIEIPAIHPTLCFGTPDAWFADIETKELHVFDLKYGWGIVEPEENLQLICYAVGILRKLDAPDTNWKFNLHISQPRAPHRFGPNRCWVAPATDVRAHVNRLESAAKEAVGESPRCVSGAHCKYCSALHVCSAAAALTYEAMDAATPFVLDNDAAAAEYFALKQAEAAIKNRLGAREGSLIAKIQMGECVPGLVLERGSGRVKWSQPASVIAALGDVMGLDLRVPEAVITPSQSKAKGLSSEIVQLYSFSGGAKLKLIPADKSFAAGAFKKCEGK